MATRLKNVSDSAVWKLVDELKRPFGRRDSKWEKRRKVRYRLMEDDLRGLPVNPRVSDTALMVYQDEAPNQEVHRRVKRLIANKPHFEVVIYDDNPKNRTLGQQLEDGIQALWRWMQRGKPSVDWEVTENQQGDGLGIYKVSFVPGHGDALAYYTDDIVTGDDEDENDSDLDEDEQENRRRRNRARSEFRDTLSRVGDDVEGREARAYDKVTDAALSRELPPYRLTSVDPLTCYWWEDDDGIEIVAEAGERALNPLLGAFEEYGLRYDSTKQRLYTVPEGQEAIGAITYPTDSMSNLAAKVNFVEIRTRHEVYIAIEHPRLNQAKQNTEDKGVVLRFDNPFGPYTTGYVLIPGDVTTASDEADRYQPSVLAALNAAGPLNILSTAQLSAAVEAALSPPYIEVKEDQPLPPVDKGKTPEQKEGAIPVVPGRMRRVESPTVELEKIADRILQSEIPYRFQEALTGGATSDTSGHRLALQVAQADIQIVPYQNARAEAIKEVVRGIIYSIKRHGLPIFIPTLPGATRTEPGIRSADRAKLTPEMADLDFEIIVSLGAETPITKFAKEQHLIGLEEAGIVGYESVVEQVADNPENEIIRVFEGKALKQIMENTLPQLTELVTNAVRMRLQQFIQPTQPEGQLPFGVNPATGLAQGGGAAPIRPEDVIRLPGVNAPVSQTVPSRDTGVQGVLATGGDIGVG